MDSAASDSLLAQILFVVQEVQVSIANFETRLDAAKEAIENLNRRIDDVIETGFPKGDIKGHRRWHEKKNLSFWRRALLRLALND